MAYPFRNLVFEGGGVKGSAYIGAIRALNEEGILPEIQRFGGTSAGAITALLLGLSIRRSCKNPQRHEFQSV